MALRNTNERYGSIAVGFHWLMALLIIGMLILGLYMTSAGKTPSVFKLYGIHKSIGAIVLMLAMLRLGWRLQSIIPPLPDAMRRIEQTLAHASHYALYFFMFAMPLSGWLMSSAAGFPVSVFGLFLLPNLVGPDKGMHEFYEQAHELMAYALILLVVLHAAAALLHHFVHKDNVFRRMLPVLLLCLLPANASAEELSPAWKVDKEHSTISFTATVNDAPVTGEFSSFADDIIFEPEYPESASVRLVITIANIKASYENVAVTLQTPDWFDAAAFPVATFEASNFKKTGEHSYHTTGALTLRGMTVPVDLDFTFEESADGRSAIAKGQAMLKRSDFGIGRGEWAKTDVVKDEVRIDFTFHATR